MLELICVSHFLNASTVGKGQRAKKSFRFDDQSTSKAWESVLPFFFSAGLGAGMMEAIFAVTPSETIKYV